MKIASTKIYTPASRYKPPKETTLAREDLLSHSGQLISQTTPYF